MVEITFGSLNMPRTTPFRFKYHKILQELGIDDPEDDPVDVIQALKRANIRLLEENAELRRKLEFLYNPGTMLYTPVAVT